MIQVFCIFLIGEPILLQGDTQELGFYRNEYVAAWSETRAVASAKVKTMKRLAQKGVNFVDEKPFELKVEEVKSGMPLWRLLRNEGFLFFPVDS